MPAAASAPPAAPPAPGPAVPGAPSAPAAPAASGGARRLPARRQAAGRPRRRLRPPAGVGRPLLPALATVALLVLPAGAMEVGGGLVAADLASGVLVAVAALLALRGRRPVLARPGAVVFGAVAVALGAVALASADQPTALAGYLRHLQVFVLVPLALLVVARTRREVRLLGGTVLVLALVQGTVGIWQFATTTGASYMGEDIRAVGTFGPLNVMGMATVVGYGLVIALAAGLAPPPGAPRRWRAAAFGCAGWLLIALAVSFSRGAWIATALAVAAVVLISGRLTRRALALLLCAAALLGAAAAAGSPQLRDRVTSIGQVADRPDQSVVDRYAMWDAARAMWREEPWTGVGLKGFADHRDSHSSIALSSGSDTGGAGMGFRRQPLESPHNMYLLVLGEQGLLGATALIGGWAALLAACLLRLRTAAVLARLRARPGRRGPGRRGGGRSGAGRSGGARGGWTRRSRAPDVALAGTGLLVWQLVNFLYADIGGPTTVLTGVVFGLAAWWAVALPPPVEETP